jgi:hypothetical protein
MSAESPEPENSHLSAQKTGVWSHYEEPYRRMFGTASDDGEQPTPARLRESRRALGRMLGRELDQMARPCGGQVRERQAVRGVGGKLRGSRAELTWHRLHVLAPHQRSQPVASPPKPPWHGSGRHRLSRVPQVCP